MKRIFNKSSQPVATSYQVPEEMYNLPPSLQPGAGNRPQPPRQDEHWNSSQPSLPPSPLKRSGGRAAAGRSNYNLPEQPYIGATSPALARGGRRPKSGQGTAYPSYGEVQLDSNDNRGGGQVNRSTAEPLEAVLHQKLPARSSVSKSPYGNHARTPSASLQQGPDSYQGQTSVHSLGEPNRSDPLQNPYNSARNSGLDRHSSMSRGQPAVRNPLRGIARRASQSQGRAYKDENSERPSRRPSLLYGIDSGVHGGYASAAMANATERDRQSASSSGQERDGSVIHAESRYTDRYIDVRTPQSVAIGNGVDKMKRRLFGRKKKDGDGGIEEGEKESSGEWARVEHPTNTDRQEMMPEAERYAEQGNGHAPWFAGRKHGNKTKEETITSQIGTICIENEDNWDWNQIQALCNAISHSEAASKEAARALRKEFKINDELVRFRAVRLWAIICTRASDRFRLQVANKKFLEVLEDLYFDEKTSTKLRGRLLLAWSMLAFEFQLDKDLFPITKMFNKVRPNEMPANGIAMDPTNELFNSPSYLTGQQEQQQQYRQQQQPNGITAPYNQNTHRDQSAALATKRSDYPAYLPEQRYVPPPPTSSTEIRPAPQNQKSTAESTEPPLQEEALHSMPRLSDDIQRLHQECTVARGNAQLMTDALIEHGLASELVVEFAAKTQQSQEFIMAQIPWASAQADRSRAERQSWTAAGGGAEIAGGQSTKEEALMEDLLDTHMKLIAANSMIEEARDRQREDEEERQAIDQSMREQRMDRSTLIQETATGQLFSVQGNNLAPPSTDGASSSRSASPTPPVVRRPLPVPGSVEMQKSASKTSQLPITPISDKGQSMPVNGEVKAAHRSGPRPMNEATSSPPTARENRESQGEIGDDSGSIIMTPTAPSAKALGKRRQMSTRESLSHDNTVTQLSSQITNTLDLEPTSNEEVLRARPPPALPQPPNHAPIVSSNSFHQ